MDYDEFKTDWRNREQIDYLFGKKLKFLQYSTEVRDHEHCEFCFERISNIQDSVREGYCTVDTKYKYWICPQCYNDLKDIFKWEIISFKS